MATEWAYQQACRAIEKHRARADTAEQRVKELEAELKVLKEKHNE